MIVVLTGAGISKESGLSTFRDTDGIWKKISLEDYATPEGFARAPEQVNAFYSSRRANLQSGRVLPNAAHFALARLEEAWVKRKRGFMLVTQNVDDLHERGGSKAVVHMHGELLRGRCQNCGQDFSWKTDISGETVCPECGLAGGMRPHVVWFGEMPLRMDEISAALDKCKLFLAIGTSGNVYPAAGFVRQARRAGARAVEINAESTVVSDFFDEQVIGPASASVAAWVDKFIADLG
jgi:NAD-dependent deacetylase